MAARVPRRSFASPFVVTLAVACTPATGPVGNPPAPQPEPVGETPTPGDTAPTATPGAAEGGTTEEKEVRWAVTKQGKDCFTQLQIECTQPPGEPARSCNPPAPQKYDCPKWDNGAAMDFDGGDTIAGVAGGKECTLYFSAGGCPEGASCNPPPPRAVACPKV